jgi:glycerol-3-phosphate dehydrogenase (NAD(P)+)
VLNLPSAKNNNGADRTGHCPAGTGKPRNMPSAMHQRSRFFNSACVNRLAGNFFFQETSHDDDYAGLQSKEVLNKLIPFMVRQAHHERNQLPTVRPELVEGLDQSFPKANDADLRCKTTDDGD